MTELVNLQECVDYVVKVVRRDDRTLYGKIRNSPTHPDDDRPFVFDLGNGGGLRYSKYGRVVKKADKLDIIWIKKIAKEEGVFDEPTKPMDEVVDRLVKKYQAQKLWNRVRDELGYSIDLCDEIVDLVEDWILDEQSSAGSQNLDVEFLVDGFNDCVRKMKEMLR